MTMGVVREKNNLVPEIPKLKRAAGRRTFSSHGLWFSRLFFPGKNPGSVLLQFTPEIRRQWRTVARCQPIQQQGLELRVCVLLLRFPKKSTHVFAHIAVTPGLDLVLDKLFQ